MLENVLKSSTDSDTLLIFIYVHLRLSAPAMSTDNSYEVYVIPMGIKT